MSGVKLHIDYNDQQIQRVLTRLIETGQNPAPIMKDIAADGRRSTQDRFIDGVAPDGSSWKPNQKGTKTLIASRILLGSITRDSGDDWAEWGTNKIYAAIHQFGGKAGRGHKAEIPARPYLGINDQDEDNILDLIVRNINESIS